MDMMMNDKYELLLRTIDRGDIMQVETILADSPELVTADLLQHAARLGSTGALTAILRAGGRLYLNDFDDISFTPLTWAAKAGHLDTVKAIIEAGADVNARDEMNCGSTALREVVETSSFEIVQALVKAGSDPNIAGWMGLNAVDKARERAERDPGRISMEILQLIDSAACRLSPGTARTPSE